MRGYLVAGVVVGPAMGLILLLFIIGLEMARAEEMAALRERDEVLA
jgi:hypothetical protein